MLSPGGKILWLCPNCESPDIQIDSIASKPFNNGGICNTCNQFFKWSERFKLTKKQQLTRLLKGNINEQ